MAIQGTPDVRKTTQDQDGITFQEGPDCNCSTPIFGYPVFKRHYGRKRGGMNEEAG